MSCGGIVVDTDPGIDDAVALALLIALAKDRVQGVTVTYGNCTVQWAAANAAAILTLCGANNIPLVLGAQRPLCRRAEPAEDTHGADGLGYARSVCRTATGAICQENRWAPDALLEWAAAAQGCGGLTLICLGPLTNLALALARNRDLLLQGINSVVVMGGSAGAAGNTTPVSEFNFWCDPEAARAVFASGLPLFMVGLDVTRQMVLPVAALRKLEVGAEHTPQPELIRTLAAAMRFYAEFHERVEGLAGCILNDPLAVLLALQPELAYSRRMYVSIECGDGVTRGQSVCDRYGHLHAAPNAGVYLEVDGRQAMWRVWNALAPGLIGYDDLQV